MKNKIRRIALLIGFVCSIPYLGFAQFTETKEINKHFKVSPTTRIELTNKYGKIELNTWNKDSVIVDIKIRVEDKKLSKLEKAISEIDFDITESDHFVIVRTIVGKNKSGLEKEIQKFKESVFQSDSKIEINYTVWLPKSNDLKVENKFGDIYIGDYFGELELNLSNGNLKSHNFEGKTNLTLSFADATINQMKSGRLDCNYSEVFMKKADNLQVTSKSSDFEIYEINELDANSRRDKFRIRLIESLEAKGSFSNFRINELTDRISLRVEYGDVDIEKTAIDFSNIYIESKSTDINLYFSEDSKFLFEINHTKTETSFCRELEIKEKKVLDEKEKNIKLTGNFGGESDTKKLFINTTSGELNINSN